MITINNLKININISGEGTRSILLLHGWGQSHEAFADVAKYFQDYYKIYNIDLPGFGLSEEPNRVFSTNDYAEIIKGIIDYFDIINPIIIGHSFGGRVAIKYASKYNHVLKLVLVDSAGIVHKKKFKYYIKVYSYKLLKKVFSLPLLNRMKEKILHGFGSSDYKNASERMKQILVKVVNEDLQNDLLNILCPTLLIWGTNDTVTPISDAYVMEQHLHDAGIVKIENAGHFSYLEDLNLFLRVLDAFFKDE